MPKVTISIEIEEDDHLHAVAAFADAYSYETAKRNDETQEDFAKRKTKEYILDIANSYSKKLIDESARAQYESVKKDVI